MSTDRSWTVAPTLLWFTGAVVYAVCGLDGGISAIADRFTPRAREAHPSAPGPTFQAKPVVVADADDDVKTPKPAPVTAKTTGDRSGGPLEDTCLDGTNDACKRWAMDSFYKAIADEKASKLGRAVRVSWYGDSVIATDAIPGRLRTKLQGELGDGGPGFIFAVAPHRFCNHEAITRILSGSWSANAISTVTIKDGLYGVGGSTAYTDSDGGKSTIKLNSGTASLAELYYLAQPKGGTATLVADGTELGKADTKGDKAPGFLAETVTGGAKKFEVRIDGAVRVFGVDLENASGAVVDNLGIVSANVKSFAYHDADAWSAQLAHRHADLVMIMIGANEAQWLGPYDQDTKDYQKHYEKILAPIRKGRPDGACLVVSPTDQAEERDGGFPSRPVMPVLVEAQRKAARAQGCAFFSTYDWMGGKGSSAKWYSKGLVGSDFQHLSTKGANKLADAVFDYLMAGYNRFAGS